MGAYAELANQHWQHTILPCTVAAIADVGITLAIFGVLLLLRRIAPRLPLLPAAAVIAAITAFGIEKIELARGSWSYSESMPVVPLVRLGFWPLLQLTLLVPIAIRLARWWTSYRFSRTPNID